MKVAKAVIPVAGLGTRFLPITKAIPKEMLPIVDKPIIHSIIEEALEAGIEEIILVNGRHKSSIEDYFDINHELTAKLHKSGKVDQAKELLDISSKGHISTIRQKEANGLGHAVLAAYPLIKNEPFAVLLGDDIIRSKKEDGPVIGQMLKAFDKTQKAQVALMQVEKSQVHLYGAAEGRIDSADKNVFHISNLVEKPPLGTEKTEHVIIGRYVLLPDIWPILKKQKPGAIGEIQLTDGLFSLMKAGKLMGYKFKGNRIDAGDKLGYIKANLVEALSRKEIKEDVLKMVKEVLSEA